MAKKIQFIGIGSQGNAFVKNQENLPFVTSFHYIEQFNEVMDVDIDTFTFLFVGNNEIDLLKCYQFATSFKPDFLAVIVLPVEEINLYCNECRKLLLDLEEHISLLIALNEPLQVEHILLKEMHLFDSITVIIDLISGNQVINIDIVDIKNISYGSKKMEFSSFELDRREKLITIDNIRANLLKKQEKIKAIIVSLTSDINLTLDEFPIIEELISSLVSDTTIVIIGLKIESGLGNVIKISMATAY